MGITMKLTNLHSPHRIGIENEDCVFFYTYQITIINFDIKHALCIVTLTYDMKSAVASSFLCLFIWAWDKTVKVRLWFTVRGTLFVVAIQQIQIQSLAIVELKSKPSDPFNHRGS